MGGTAGSLAHPCGAAASVAAGRPVLVHSFDEWRACARDLLAHKVAPSAVQWISHKDDGDLFSAGAEPAPAPGVKPGSPTVRISRKLMDMLQTAACCRVPNRWAFLYLVMWRWQQGEHDVLSAADEDGAKLHAMVKAVKREEHDMHAYIRFRERRADAGPPQFVAWFEPSHDVLPQVARHFAARMGRITWMIATPEASVMWDGATLHSTGPLMRGPEDIDDAGEALWLTYYRSIFNPARLNADLMHGHIPSRFWKNLPEGSVVPAMVSQAAAGARKVGQTRSVGERGGTIIPIAANKAQPQRDAPSTLDACRRCELWKDATQAVPGAGPEKARIMLVGEQPGDQEDLRGRPFVGPAGQLFDRALQRIGVARESVYLSNAVRHFKYELRGKRRIHKSPAVREIAACRRAGVLVTLHPSALLRVDPEDREAAFEAFVQDLRQAQRLFRR